MPMGIHLSRLILILGSTLSLLTAGPRILFVKGGPGKGGFLEGGSDDQLCDITDYSTRGGNHGWGELADWLRENEFELEQVEEGPANDNTPVPFADMELGEYDVILLGSNNADYEARHVDAIENWVKDGGGLLVISDANFGRNWGDAPDSDQQFLDRFGWVMNQDQGTYALRRSSNDFLVPSHPIFEGVDSFDGEGVSPIMVPSEKIPGVLTTIVARANGTTRINNRYSQGSSRQTNDSDGSLVTAEVGEGRVVGHFDRNTFFNLNGAGTNLNRLDNRTYALNLFRWLAFGGGGLEVLVEAPKETSLTLASSEEEVGFIVSTELFGKKLSIFNPPSYQWSLLEGAGSATFDDPTRETPSVRFSTSGMYRIQVMATHRDREAVLVIEVNVEIGLSDLLTEAFGTASPQPELQWINAGNDSKLQLSYSRADHMSLTFSLEHSFDLENWTSSEVVPDLSKAGLVSFIVPSDSPASYVRVRVE